MKSVQKGIVKFNKLPRQHKHIWTVDGVCVACMCRKEWPLAKQDCPSGFMLSQIKRDRERLQKRQQRLKEERA